MIEGETPFEGEDLRRGKLLLRAARDAHAASRGIDVGAVHDLLKKGGDLDLCTKGLMAKDVYGIACESVAEATAKAKAAAKEPKDKTKPKPKACWWCGRNGHTAHTCTDRPQDEPVPRTPRPEAVEWRRKNGLGGF